MPYLDLSEEECMTLGVALNTMIATVRETIGDQNEGIGDRSVLADGVADLIELRAKVAPGMDDDGPVFRRPQ